MSQSPAESDPPPAVVLLSGGLDSATVLAIARAEGYAAHALTFDYGQRHRAELEAAAKLAEALEAASHRVQPLDLRAYGGSALTDQVEVPKHRSAEAMASGIPVTYVPARNTIFLAHALALAEVLGARDLFIGVNAVDYSGYPDCRPDYVEAFERMANLATRAAVLGAPLKIHAPLMHLAKTAIIERGLELGVDYGLTHSCYDPGPGARACGACDACLIRREAFEKLGRADPAR